MLRIIIIVAVCRPKPRCDYHREWHSTDAAGNFLTIWCSSTCTYNLSTRTSSTAPPSEFVRHERDSIPRPPGHPSSTTSLGHFGGSVLYMGMQRLGVVHTVSSVLLWDIARALTDGCLARNVIHRHSQETPHYRPLHRPRSVTQGSRSSVGEVHLAANNSILFFLAFK